MFATFFLVEQIFFIIDSKISSRLKHWIQIYILLCDNWKIYSYERLGNMEFKEIFRLKIIIFFFKNYHKIGCLCITANATDSYDEMCLYLQKKLG